MIGNLLKAAADLKSPQTEKNEDAEDDEDYEGYITKKPSLLSKMDHALLKRLGQMHKIETEEENVKEFVKKKIKRLHKQ